MYSPVLGYIEEQYCYHAVKCQQFIESIYPPSKINMNSTGLRKNEGCRFHTAEESYPLNKPREGKSQKYDKMDAADDQKSNQALNKHEDGTLNAEKDDDLLDRGKWTGKLDFILALIGFSVGLGNVWRFPYLCYKNGGGAFLIPYFICLIVGGIPLLILELGLGQFTAQGGVTSWGILPIFKGIGGASIVILTLLNTYYIVIMAWSLYYMIMSFNKVVPWSTCDNEWNTEYCFVPGTDVLTNCSTGMTTTLGMAETTEVPCIDPEDKISASVEFWERKILQIHLSTGLGDPGGMNWQMVLCLLMSWVLVYLCIFKGVKSSGKVVYFTATFPYILLTILLIRAVTLDNAIEGIIFYLKPDISKLKESQVWLDAATQIFFSYSLGLGTMAALGSYNKYKNNFIRDALIFSATNSGTSIYSGFVIFSMLGFMAGNQNKEVSEVAKSGPGLVFVVYPEGLAQMPLAPLWSVLFFFMLILLGIDSEFVGVEGFVTAIVDIFPSTFRRGYRREIFAAIVCAGFFLLGLTMTTYGGMYVFQLFDYYSASGVTLLWVATFECIAIGWVYGVKKMNRNFYEMSSWKFLNPYLCVTWICVTPLFTSSLFVFSIVSYEPLLYNNVYEYPPWGYAIGWLMAVSSMIVPPVYICFKLFIDSNGSLKERWTLLTTSILPSQSRQNVPGEVISAENGDVVIDSEMQEYPPPSYTTATGEGATAF